MNNSAPTSRGQAAEALAAEFLKRQGFKTLERNWKTRWCEIDLIGQKSGIIHFIEVKYRQTPLYGTGFEYVTRDKQNRLTRAALMWITANRPDAQYQIDVIAVTGPMPNPKIEYLSNAVTD